MTTWQTFVAGWDPDHLPALWAGLLFALIPLLAKASRRLAGHPWSTPRNGVTTADRVAGWLLADSAAIHLALPIGHHDDPTLTFLFLASGVAYGVLGWRALVGGRYRAASAVLIVATLIAYIDVVAAGGEGADQVGIVTALLELVALGICLVPRGHAPVRRTFGSIAFVLAVVLSGSSIWVTSFVAHGHAAVAVSDGTGSGASGGHQGADRAQAGIIMAPVEAQTPTPAQVAAANALAARTKAALVRYTDIQAAIADGYRPSIGHTGLRVHLENSRYQHDGRILDPRHPEALMYAIDEGKATLLGAVFQMPRTGQPGPTPGGPITRWHSHDVCLTLLPPGYTVVNAYGTCPLLAISVTIPQMMHVWTVDHPGGPFDDDSPDAWIRAYNETHGIPFTW
jgi:hypothetical protein